MKYLYFVDIHFDVDRRMLERQGHVVRADARRDASAWGDLGYHLRVCHDAFTYDGSWRQIAECLRPLAVMTAGMAFWLLTMLLAINCAAGMLSILPTLPLAAIAAWQGKRMVSDGWFGWLHFAARAREGEQVMADARAGFYARLWADVQAWNRDVPGLNVLVKVMDQYPDMPKKSPAAAVQIRRRLAKANERWRELRQRLELAQFMLGMGGELGNYAERPDLDAVLLQVDGGHQPPVNTGRNYEALWQAVMRFVDKLR